MKVLRQKSELTLGLFDFRRDHNRRTPSRRSMILQRKKNKEFNFFFKKNSNKDKEKRKKNSRHVVRLSRTGPHCIGDVY